MPQDRSAAVRKASCSRNTRIFELILVNDGSKDDTPAILDALAAEDERVKVIHQENAGVSAARNHGIDAAQGKYLQFMDADDWLSSDATKLMVRMAEDNQCDMIIADFLPGRW